MKEKIAKELKNKYSNLGLGEKAFNGVASFLEKTVTNEEDIANAIAGDDVKALLTAIQGETDRLRADKAAAEKALRDVQGGAKKTEEGEDSEVVKLLKQMQIEQATLKSQLEQSKKEARTKEILSGVREKMRSAGSDNDFILNIVLKNAEVGDADTVDTLAEKFKASYDENYKAAYGDGPTPRGGVHRTEGYKKGDFADAVKMLQNEGMLPQENK